MIYRNRSKSNRRNDSSNIYLVFNNTKPINLNELEDIKNIQSIRNRKIFYYNPKLETSNISSRDNTPINTISKNKTKYKSINVPNMSINKYSKKNL